MIDGDCVFSTDQYFEASVKSMERLRRGVGERLMIGGSSTRRPSDWKLFLQNDCNKEQLIQLLLVEWQKDEYSSRLKDRQVILICKGSAYLLTSDGVSVQMKEVPTLNSNQEETDTRIILYVKYAESQGYKYVRVRSPDTDVFHILLHYARSYHINILFDTGSGNHKRLINISDLARSLTQTYCSALLTLHAFTGSDTTSALKGRGKVKPLKILKKFTTYQESLSTLGNEWEVSYETYSIIEEFTCRIYGQNKENEVNSVRFMKINEICGSKKNQASVKNFDMSSLPPCRRTLETHIKRVNYQVGIWKRSHVANPEIPDPEDHGWIKINEILQPQWFEGSDIPEKLEELESGDLSEDDDSDSDIDYDSETQTESDVD